MTAVVVAAAADSADKEVGTVPAAEMGEVVTAGMVQDRSYTDLVLKLGVEAGLVCLRMATMIHFLDSVMEKR